MNKKFIALVMLLFAFSLFTTDAFALNTKSSQGGRSDEVWTKVKIGEGYANLVSRGSVVVASISGVTVADNDGYLAQLSTVSTDRARVLGVAQAAIASGGSRLVLAKGRGDIRAVGPTIASRDNLAITEGATLTSRDGCVVAEASVNSTESSDRATIVATALEAYTSGADSTIKAYIDVL